MEIHLNENINVVGIPIGNPDGNAARDSYQKRILAHVQVVCALAEQYEYHLEQRNGQRIFGPPFYHEGEEPQGNCEIFIGRIPKDIFEDTLVPLLIQNGRLYKLRLMMDFSGNNRGFAFATFFSHSDAVRTCQMLDNFEIAPGKFLGVVLSHDNKEITLSYIPYSDMIPSILSTWTAGVTKVQIEPKNGTNSYVQVRVVYENHRDAALARRFLMQSAVNLFNSDRFVLVDWSYRIQNRNHNFIHYQHPIRKNLRKNNKSGQR